MSFKFTYLRQPLKRYTFQAPKTRAWLEALCKDKVVLNLFGGPTRLTGVAIEFSNDLDRSFGTTYNVDALECVKALAEQAQQLFNIACGVKQNNPINEAIR